MDYGKFKFDAAQRAKESRRKAVHVGIKEMKYRPKIGDGDFDTKTRQVAKFLEEGHKVKITIMFRGREVFHPELGKKILDRIADQMDGMGKSESVPRLDGRNMVMVLAPDKRAKQSAASRDSGHNGNGSAPDAAAAATAPAPAAAPPATAGTEGAPEASAAPPEATPSDAVPPATAPPAGDGSPAQTSSEGEG
jgi:translation initiation factor IF-3